MNPNASVQHNGILTRELSATIFWRKKQLRRQIDIFLFIIVLSFQTIRARTLQYIYLISFSESSFARAYKPRSLSKMVSTGLSTISGATKQGKVEQY
jgi:hypothetical protein